MRKVLTSRGCGKTTEAIKTALRDDLLLVVHSYAEMERITKWCKTSGFKTPKMSTYEEFLGSDKKYFADIKCNGVIIDNVEMFLIEVCRPFTIKMATMSIE